MATTAYLPLQQTLGDFVHYARLDDFAAVAAVALLSTAYISKGRLWRKPDPYSFKLYERPQQQPGAIKAAEQSKNLAERLEQSNANIAILWASQSGTAERMAGRLAKDLRKHFGARVLLLDLSDIDPASCADLPETKLAIFLASTFGEGDPSDNMHDFWAWLHQDQGDLKDLSALRYLAFGLGNSNYKHYNHVIDVVASQLEARGAHALLPTARADDANGDTEEHFLEWKECVFDVFQGQLGYKQQEAGYEPSLRIIEDASLEPIDLHHGIPQTRNAKKPSSTESKIYALPIIQSRELFSDATDRNCVHMELDLSPFQDLKYRTGDHLAIWPVNPAAEVELLVNVLGLNGRRSSPCLVQSADDTPVKVPSPTTIDALLEHYLEVCAPVSREHVGLLATFAPTDAARDLLTKISAEKLVYAEYLASNHVTLGRLLQSACGEDGAWVRLPMSLVIEVLPAMQPRYYSISSSSVVQARKATITAVVSDTTLSTSGERIPGLATNYLLSQMDGQHPRGIEYSMPTPHQPLQRGKIHAHLRKSGFKLPALASTPIVMVGAGTGVAPFRAFIQERARLKGMGREVGPTKLYFGCRNAAQDFIYEDDIAEAAVKLEDAFSMTTAFSRPDNAGNKRYVQDRIVEEAAQVCDLLMDGNAYFYICGSAAMAREVTDAVAKIVMARQGWTEEQMKGFADRQKRQKRWHQDVWG
ncbi:NADPH-cytochrome P450 reductase [Elasticomyces elasticus]|uniref:NADPH--cytochrome P450 reductase n=1 Tax=Elasticomyces elasticus TaxID=574655 RepID=A0AAN7W7B7_9PEZI|nr:NADPH-cytochrome P450 reductase [Elasticomyces elasticus]